MYSLLPGPGGLPCPVYSFLPEPGGLPCPVYLLLPGPGGLPCPETSFLLGKPGLPCPTPAPAPGTMRVTLPYTSSCSWDHADNAAHTPAAAPGPPASLLELLVTQPGGHPFHCWAGISGCMSIRVLRMVARKGSGRRRLEAGWARLHTVPLSLAVVPMDPGRRVHAPGCITDLPLLPLMYVHRRG